MKIITILFFCLPILAGISCNKPYDKKRESKISPENVDEIKTNQVFRTAACGGSYGGTYTVINSYYVYPLQLLNVFCADSNASITVSVSALDIPNRFSLVDQNGNYVTGTGWLGSASFYGYWGPPFSNSGQGTITFQYNPQITYFLRVQTQTAPNSNYNPSTDGWAADVSCICGSGGPGSGGGSCSCDSSYGGTYAVINSYYVYPYEILDFSCLDSTSSNVTIDVSALDVPNRFSIIDQTNNYVAGTGWLGSASYSGYWGAPFSNTGQGTFTFQRNPTNTYYLRIETHTPPDYSYSPSTDGWWVGVSCD